jgi:hypothetical protein
LARLIRTRNGRTRHYDGQILTPIPNPKTGHLGVDLYRDRQGATPVRRAQMPIGLFSLGERQPIGRHSGPMADPGERTPDRPDLGWRTFS